MFRHCVMFRFKDGTTPATVAEVRTALDGLRHLPMVRRYEFGTDAGLAEDNFDFALVADFDDRAGYEAYAADPAHVAVLSGHLRPNIAARSAVQYDIDR
jgi:hypothetical protein